MPRNMSFSLTTRQYRDQTKDVTRRLGWWNLKAGEIVNGVEKAMGLRKGQKIVVLGQHRIVSTRAEPLNVITVEDCRREGFPELTPAQFVDMFCQHNHCTPETVINRIEFQYVDIRFGRGLYVRPA